MQILQMIIFAATAASGIDDPTRSTKTLVASDSRVGQTKEIIGFGPLHFGMSYDDVLKIYDYRYFNSYSMQQCIQDMPIKGCFLAAAETAPTVVKRAGIPYKISASFNRFDKLTDVNLGYDREGDITPDQCMDLSARTLDWLIEDFGDMRESSAEGPSEKRSTPNGHTYSVWKSKTGSMLTRMMRTISAWDPSLSTRPITTWDDRAFVALHTVFLVVDRRQSCSVSVNFREPSKVERRQD